MAKNKEGGKNKKNKKLGAPTKYEKEKHDLMAYAAMSKGTTLESLAKKMGVSPAAIYIWQKKHKSFLESISSGKRDFDESIVMGSKLLKRVKGYKTKILRSTYEVNDKGDKVLTQVTEEEKEIPPDVNAISLWTKLRKYNQLNIPKNGTYKDQYKSIIESLNGETIDLEDGLKAIKAISEFAKLDMITGLEERLDKLEASANNETS